MIEHPMSAALFLTFKIAWNEGNGTDLVLMLSILAGCSIFIWIRTFFLMPEKFLDPSKSVWSQSFIGSRFPLNKTEQNRTEEIEEDNKEIAQNDSSLKESTQSLGNKICQLLKEFNTWQYSLFYCIL